MKYRTVLIHLHDIVFAGITNLKWHCIEFKYYADAVYILVLPRRVNNS